jgi:polyphenol oxidase
VIDLWQTPVDGGRRARVAFTTRADGDLASSQPPETVAPRRASVLDRPWIWTRQLHGADVLEVSADVAPDAVVGAEADASVTSRDDVVLSVNVADCAPVALVSRQGVIGVVHAGWRGLSAGVIEGAVRSMRRLGGRDIEAFLGPCIHPECYEFGADELDLLRAQFGPAIVGRTATGNPALDVPTAVAAALGRVDVALVGAADRCTACDASELYSHRARGDVARHAMLVWLEPASRESVAPDA